MILTFSPCGWLFCWVTSASILSVHGYQRSARCFPLVIVFKWEFFSKAIAPNFVLDSTAWYELKWVLWSVSGIGLMESQSHVTVNTPFSLARREVVTWSFSALFYSSRTWHFYRVNLPFVVSWFDLCSGSVSFVSRVRSCGHYSVVGRRGNGKFWEHTQFVVCHQFHAKPVCVWLDCSVLRPVSVCVQPFLHNKRINLWRSFVMKARSTLVFLYTPFRSRIGYRSSWLTFFFIFLSVSLPSWNGFMYNRASWLDFLPVCFVFVGYPIRISADIKINPRQCLGFSQSLQPDGCQGGTLKQSRQLQSVKVTEREQCSSTLHIHCT